MEATYHLPAACQMPTENQALCKWKLSQTATLSQQMVSKKTEGGRVQHRSPSSGEGEKHYIFNYNNKNVKLQTCEMLKKKNKHCSNDELQNSLLSA